VPGNRRKHSSRLWRDHKEVADFLRPAVIPDWITWPREDGCVQVAAVRIDSIDGGGKVHSSSFFIHVYWDRFDKEVRTKRYADEAAFQRDLDWIPAVVEFEAMENRGWELE